MQILSVNHPDVCIHVLSIVCFIMVKHFYFGTRFRLLQLLLRIKISHQRNTSTVEKSTNTPFPDKHFIAS